MNKDKDKVVTGHIYILHFPFGKRYVGQTVRSLKERMEEHWWPSKGERKLPVNSAIKKYGKESIKIEKVFILKCTQEYLDLMEDRAITKWNTMAPNGYNIKRGGSHGAHNEETKIKISTALKGRPGTWLGRHRSEETKAKVSAARKGKCLSKETKAKLSAINQGKILSDKTKARMSAAKKGKLCPHEGRSRTEESIIKRTTTRRKNNFGYYHKQGYRPRPWLRGRHLSEETIAKRSATRKVNASLKKLKQGVILMEVREDLRSNDVRQS